jgi:uncharacterized protein (TIGR00369 family)
MPSEQDFDIAQWMNNGLSGFDRTMGFRMLRATPDEVILEYDAGEQHHQPYGIVHGGVHSAAVETVCSTGAGLYARIQGQAGVVGVENHTSFLRAVRTGRVRVTGKPLSRGRRSQVWEATARNEEGKIVSTGRVRLLCLEAGSEIAGEKIGAGPEE